MPQMLCRMRHPDGIAQLLSQMGMHFHVPPPGDPAKHSPAAQAKLFRTFIYLSQVMILQGCLAHQPRTLCTGLAGSKADSSTRTQTSHQQVSQLPGKPTGTEPH